MADNENYVWELLHSKKFNRFLERSKITQFLDTLRVSLQRLTRDNEILYDSKHYVTIKVLTVSLEELYLQFHFGSRDCDYHSIYGHRVVRIRALHNVTNEIAYLASPNMEIIFVKRMTFESKRMALLFTHVGYPNDHCVVPQVVTSASKVYGLLSNVSYETN